MKKITNIITLLFPIILIAILFGYGWYAYPWRGIIEKRIEKIGPNNLINNFDSWIKVRDPLNTKWEEIQIKELPISLRVPGVKEAILRKEGLYLLVRRRFVESDYILIRSEENFPILMSSGDPKFTELRNRIWYVEIKG